MTADSEEFMALKSDPKSRELPSALSDILDRAPEKGILHWLAEIDRIVEETVRENDRIGGNLIAAMTFHILNSREKRDSGDVSKNELLSIAGTSQAARSFFSKKEGFEEQKGLALNGISMALIALGKSIPENAEARLLLSRAIELGEEEIRAYPADEYPEKCLSAHEILGTALRHMFVRKKGYPGSTDHLEREIKVWEESIRLESKSNPSGRGANYQLALASAVQELYKYLDEPVARDMLDRASRYMEDALKKLHRNSEPDIWIKIQEYLGLFRSKQAELENERKSYHSYLAAGNAYREALHGMKREDDPVRWAHSKHGFADALRMQVIRSPENSENIRLLEDSIDAYENAVQVFTGEKFPELFVRLGNEYGDVLRDLGLLSQGTKSRQLLERSVEVMEKAKEYLDSVSCGYEWEELHERLAFTLFDLSSRCPDEETAMACLRRSAELGKELLKDMSGFEGREAHAREFLASVYAEMGNRASDRVLAGELFDKSIRHYEVALPHFKGTWQNEIKNTLKELRLRREKLPRSRKK